MIEFVDIESSSYVKSFFTNIPKNEGNEILEYIPPQNSMRRAIYDKYAWYIRTKEKLLTRAKIEKNDY